MALTRNTPLDPYLQERIFDVREHEEGDERDDDVTQSENEESDHHVKRERTHDVYALKMLVVHNLKTQ